MVSVLKRDLNLKRSVKLLWEGSARWTVVTLAVMLLLGIQPVVSLYLHKSIIDLISDALINKKEIVMGALATLIVSLAVIEIFACSSRVSAAMPRRRTGKKSRTT